jgi:hypothetical protein
MGTIIGELIVALFSLVRWLFRGGNFAGVIVLGALVWIVHENSRPAVATPSQSPTSYATVSTSPLEPQTNAARWPDGRILDHPDHFVKTYVFNVAENDTLSLRAGPGTRFEVVARIPPDAYGLSAYDQDQVWDGDTWWCPVEWNGFRGYVGSSYLPRAN